MIVDLYEDEFYDEYDYYDDWYDYYDEWNGDDIYD